MSVALSRAENTFEKAWCGLSNWCSPQSEAESTRAKGHTAHTSRCGAGEGRRWSWRRAVGCDGLRAGGVTGFCGAAVEAWRDARGWRFCCAFVGFCVVRSCLPSLPFAVFSDCCRGARLAVSVSLPFVVFSLSLCMRYAGCGIYRYRNVTALVGRLNVLGIRLSGITSSQPHWHIFGGLFSRFAPLPKKVPKLVTSRVPSSNRR